MEDYISEKYFILFDHGHTTMFSIDQLEKCASEQQLYKNIHDNFDEYRSPRLFTRKFIEVRGQDHLYEEYLPGDITINKE